MALSKKVQRSIDPNNKFWSNDKNRFGYKFLTKFGWDESKGLGLNEDGRTEYIKTKVKKDNLGVGADIKTDGWMSTSHDFDNVLSKLASINNQSNPLENKFEASVEIEQEIRSGLGNEIHNESLTTHQEIKIAPKHFIPRKVFKAKNAINYNKNDIDMVLGKSNIKKTSDELDKYKADKVIEYLEKESSINEKKSTMSIQDYFKHKIAMNSLKNIDVKDLKDIEDDGTKEEEKKKKKRKNKDRKEKKDKKDKKKKDKKDKKEKKKKKRAKLDEN